MFNALPNLVKIGGFITFFTKKAASKFYFAGESHPFWEMVYVSEGSVGITADERVYMLSAGDVIFHKPMEFHRIWSGEGTTPVFHVISFVAEGSFVKSLEKTAVKCDGAMTELIKKVLVAKDEAFTIVNADRVAGIKNEFAAFECIKMLELFICRATLCGDAVATAPENDAEIFGRAVNFMHERLFEHLTVDDVASGCFVSKSKLKKIFSKYMGFGVSEYFTHLKIKKACRLLEGGESVGKVSEELGFSNQFYFSEVFKKIMKISPSKYKTEHKKA